MPVVISRDSELGKELAKWDTPRNRFVEDSSGEPVRDSAGNRIMGMGPIGIEPYPKMLYRARTLPNGQGSVGEVPPHPMYALDAADFERKCLFVESFNKSCQIIVRSNEEERRYVAQGWATTQERALEIYEQDQQAISNAAAEAAYTAQRMSAKAQEELAEAGKTTHQHVTDVIGVPKSRRSATGKAEGVVQDPSLD
jgi:hypothetical protein